MATDVTRNFNQFVGKEIELLVSAGETYTSRGSGRVYQEKSYQIANPDTDPVVQGIKARCGDGQVEFMLPNELGTCDHNRFRLRVEGEIVSETGNTARWRLQKFMHG